MISTYKKFTLNDLMVYPKIVHKSYNFPKEIFNSSTLSYNEFISFYIEEPNSIRFNQIISLYYKGFNEEGELTKALYNNSYSINLRYNEKRKLPQNEIFILSIPKRMYADSIKPNSLTLEIRQNNNYIDDGNGNLINVNGDYVGNIIYEHGIIIIHTMPPEIREFNSIKFKNTYTIYETQYICTIEDNEFNYSNNKTFTSVLDYAQESFFTPYVTCIGLYNENYVLMAVAKLSQPYPLSINTNLNFQIKIDR